VDTENGFPLFRMISVISLLPFAGKLFWAFTLLQVLWP